MVKIKKENKNMFFKKAQAFSTEIVVVIIVILVGTLFIVAQQFNEKQNSNPEIERLNQKSIEESKLVFEKLKSDNIIDSENKVNIERLNNLDEDQIKEELGITGDFAIVFEKEGKLVKINPEDNQTCIGSSKIVVNGVSCK